MTSKKCTGCYKMLPLNMFSYNKTRNQYQSRCKSCRAHAEKTTRARIRITTKNRSTIKIDDDMFNAFINTK